MNARTGEIAHDVAWARPPGIPGVLILGYNGAARATKAQIDAWGRPFLCGFESSTTRAYAGGPAGWEDGGFTVRSFGELGYPRECGSWLCAADANATPAQFLGNIEEYGFNYALRLIADGRNGPILCYGNPDAVEALARGIRRAGLVALRWGVGTWGYGEGGGPNMPPAEADAELVQSGNTPGQAEGTDLNWLYASVAVFGAWGGPPLTTPIEPYLEDGMTLYFTDHGGDGNVEHWYRDTDGLLVEIDNQTAVRCGAFDPKVQKVNVGGGVLAVVAWNQATIAAWDALGVNEAIQLTDAQIAKLGKAVADAMPKVDGPTAGEVVHALGEALVNG